MNASFWLVMAALLPLASGCLRSCGQLTVAEWTQDNLFENFPPEGKRGDFDVYYLRDRDGQVADKNAQSTDSTELTLSVDSRGRASWFWNSMYEHSDTETQERMDSMFKELGLPPPVGVPHPFVWGGNEC